MGQAAHSVSTVRKAVGLVVGLGITAMSMASGFIWASQGQILPVYMAGFFAWTGYMLAHVAVVGVFVDDIPDPSSGTTERTEPTMTENSSDGRVGHVREAFAHLRSILPAEPRRAIGFLSGIAILVVGIALLAWFVRQENHLLGNVGSGLFLTGYVIAHYFDAGKLL